MIDPKSRRDQNREARHTAIVSVARDAFLENGYAATSMSTIAVKLGGSKGTLWAYFPSKEDLFTAVIDDVTANFRQNVRDALRPGRDCHTTLLDFAERFLVKLLQPDSVRLHRLIIGEAGRFPEIGRIFYTRGPQVVLEQLSAYILGQMDAGVLRTADPAQAALNLIQLTQAQHNLRLWGIVDFLDDEVVGSHATNALDLFARAYALSGKFDPLSNRD